MPFDKMIQYSYQIELLSLSVESPISLFFAALQAHHKMNKDNLRIFSGDFSFPPKLLDYLHGKAYIQYGHI